MTELLKTMGIIILQRIPYVRNLESVQNAGTVAGALKLLNRTLEKLERVQQRNAEQAILTEETIRRLETTKQSQLEEAANAERIRGNIESLTR